MARKKKEDEAGGDKRSLSARFAARRTRREPLDVQVTLAFRFGEEEGDKVTMLNERSIPMVGNVFQYRDRIARSFALLMLRAGVSQPKVVAEILPAASWFRTRRRADNENDKG